MAAQNNPIHTMASQLPRINRERQHRRRRFFRPFGEQLEDRRMLTTAIIDNDDPGYSDTGTFALWTNQGHLGDVREDPAGGAAGTATFTLDGLVEGAVFNVAAAWTPFGNRAPDAPYTIHGVDGGPTTIVLNQTSVPDDLIDQSTPWENLGTFTVDSSGAIVVELSGSASGNVIADAIRFD